MATCTKCGAELAENEKFCGVCGTPVAAAAPAQESAPAEETAPVKETAPAKEEVPVPAAAPAQDSASAQTATPYNYKNNFTETAAEIKQSMREFAGSGVFLLYIIASIAGVVLNCIGHDTVTIIGSLIVYIPTILIIIGMLMGYADAKSADGPVGKGIGLYKAGNIIGIIFIAVIGILLILTLTLGAFAVNSSPDILNTIYESLPSEVSVIMGGAMMSSDVSSSMATVTMIITIVVIVVFMILMILYYRSLIKAATSIRKSLARGRRSGHVSVYPVVILVIIAIFTIIGCIFTLVSLPGLEGQLQQVLDSMNIDPEVVSVSTTTSIIPVIDTIVSVVRVILGIILLTQLRKRINKI